MARKQAAQQETTVDESAAETEHSVSIPGKWTPDDETRGSGGPSPMDGHDQIVEEAVGIGPDPAMTAPLGDPGDLSSFGRGVGLPDLGVGDDSALGDPTDPGGDLGSTLLDDLTGGTDLADPTDGVGGMSDGWSPPVIDDQTGWAMDDGASDSSPDSGDRILEGTSAEQFTEGSDHMAAEAMKAFEAGNDVLGNFLLEASEAAADAADERNVQEDLQSREAPNNESMPVPDEFEVTNEGGELDPTVTGVGGDPAPETEDHGGGEMIGGRGDVDPDPQLDDAGGSGGLDMERLGLGSIDPLEGESSLLAGDTGDLEEMAEAADLGADVEIEFDDSIGDAGIGEEA
jgi:hypothetical protein